jgi:hypothetical protein
MKVEKTIDAENFTPYTISIKVETPNDEFLIRSTLRRGLNRNRSTTQRDTKRNKLIRKIIEKLNP